jgi:hypothetical protein
MLKGMDNNPAITQVGVEKGANAVNPHNCQLLQEVFSLYAIASKWENIKPFFEDIDIDHTKTISREEFRAKMNSKLSAAMVDRFFESLDTNHDQQITYEEFHTSFFAFSNRNRICAEEVSCLIRHLNIDPSVTHKSVTELAGLVQTLFSGNGKRAAEAQLVDFVNFFSRDFPRDVAPARVSIEMFLSEWLRLHRCGGGG